MPQHVSASSIRVSTSHPPPLPSSTRWNNRMYLYAPSEGVAHVRLLKRFSFPLRLLFIASTRGLARIFEIKGGVFNLIREGMFSKSSGAHG